MKESIFRAYDIRGTVEKEFILESVFELSKAIAYFFYIHYPQAKKIVLGCDGRIHSKKIKIDLVKGFLESGFDVFDVGLVPSPVVYFALHTEQFDVGIIITASHNGKYDNGIKINIGKNALESFEIQLIKKYFFEKKYCNSDAIVHGVYNTFQILEKYITFLKQKFFSLIGMSTPIVIDLGNGVGSVVLEPLVAAMGWKNCTLLYAHVDGAFPNHDPNPTKLKNMLSVQQCILEKKANFGIGIDGDGDRFAVMTNSGKLLQGDQVLALFILDALEQNDHVIGVCNVLNSDVLSLMLESRGAKMYIVPVGNPIMRKEMVKQNALIGGETSGHFFFKDRYYGFDDGFYAMLRFFELMHKSDLTVDQRCEIFPHSFLSPEYRIFCKEDEKLSVIQSVVQYFQNLKNNVSEISEVLLIDGVRVRYKKGWLIIRASNTESIISIRFESLTKNNFAYIQKQLLQALPVHLQKQLLEIHE